jgi:hypothetical protein
MSSQEQRAKTKCKFTSDKRKMFNALLRVKQTYIGEQCPATNGKVLSPSIKIAWAEQSGGLLEK